MLKWLLAFCFIIYKSCKMRRSINDSLSCAPTGLGSFLHGGSEKVVSFIHSPHYSKKYLDSPDSYILLPPGLRLPPRSPASESTAPSTSQVPT